MTIADDFCTTFNYIHLEAEIMCRQYRLCLKEVRC